MFYSRRSCLATFQGLWPCFIHVLCSKYSFLYQSFWTLEKNKIWQICYLALNQVTVKNKVRYLFHLSWHSHFAFWCHFLLITIWTLWEIRFKVPAFLIFERILFQDVGFECRLVVWRKNGQYIEKSCPHKYLFPWNINVGKLIQVWVVGESMAGSVAEMQWRNEKWYHTLWQSIQGGERAFLDSGSRLEGDYGCTGIRN